MIQLHVHTKFSIGDALPSSSSLAEKMNGGVLAITDHDTMSGIVDHHQSCKKFGVKPIYGSEVTTPQNNRITLLAKNNDGLKNLFKLMSVPKDYENLSRHSNGIIAMSGDLMGALPISILRKDKKSFNYHLKNLLDIYGDNFYLEQIDHGLKEQKIINNFYDVFSKKNNLKTVKTNDVHYLNKEDANLHAVLLCSNMGKDVGHFYHINREAYLKDVDTETAKEIADMCDADISIGGSIMPDFPIPVGYPNEFIYLKSLVADGLKRNGLIKNKEYIDRAKYELQVIEKMGFCGYFLIVSDFISWAKRNNIPVGPGRGSGAGSLVAYTTGITNIDPIRYGLLFERFLNPDRISLPDFDVDFSQERRKEVIAYVTSKYGKDYVSQIATMGGLKPRAAWKAAARSYSINFEVSNLISQKLPSAADVDTNKISLSKILDEECSVMPEYPEYSDLSEYISQYKDVFKMARNLEGAYKEMGKHAAGVLISREKIVETIPAWSEETFPGESNGFISQLQYTDAEKMGMVKFDFLGLVELDVIQYATELIKQEYGVDVSKTINEIEYINDSKTFSMISEGDTLGVFQAQGAGFAKFMIDLKPTEFNDLIAGVALYRPGPKDVGMHDEYAKRKNGESNVVYPHDDLEPALSDTYGIIIYQEQVMEVAKIIAGYSLGEADIMRRAMGKKKKEEMDIQYEKFMSGGLKKYSKELITDIWHQVETFARYGFNKSHAAVYAKIMYQTAWLKSNYPEALLAAQMEKRYQDISQISMYKKNAQRIGLDVIDFNINQSAMKFSIRKNAIRMGLKSIKGISESVALSIEKGQPYKNVTDFIDRGCSEVSRSQLDALIYCGALDCLFDGDIYEGRKILLAHTDKFLKSSKKTKSNHNQLSMFAKEEYGYSEPPLQMSEEDMLHKEYEYCEMYISKNPCILYRKKLKEIGGTALEDISSVDMEYLVCAIVKDIKEHFDSNGNLMLFVNLADETEEIRSAVFASNKEVIANLKVGQLRFFRLKTSLYKGDISTNIEEVKRPRR